MTKPWEDFQKSDTKPWEDFKTPEAKPWEDFPSSVEETPQPTGPYTLNDVTPDLARSYMRPMIGPRADEWSDEEVVEKAINRYRSFSAGNSVTATRELNALYQMEDNDLTEVGKFYTFAENAEGIFSDESTWGEMGEGLVDYARSAVFDPINVFSLGIGKAVASGSIRPATRIAQKAAMSEYKKVLAKKGIKDEALKAANKKFALSLGTEATEETAKILAKTTKGKVIKEVGTSVAIDTAAGVGTEIAFQNGMIATGVQEEVDRFSVGIVALGAMTLGGVSLGMATRNSGLSPIDASTFTATPEQANSTLEVGEKAITKMLEEGNWKSKVSKGVELKDLDNDFFLTMIFGDTEKNIPGLIPTMQEVGVVWNRRSDEDKVANWIGDVLNKADPEVMQKFVKTFEDKTGIQMKHLSDEMVESEGLDAFVNVFSKKMSDSGRLLNSLSQVARLGGTKGVKVTDEELAKMSNAEAVNLIFGVAPKAKSKASTKIEGATKYIGENLRQFQNNTIRMLVSSPSTTALNVSGWGAATTQSSVADIALAVFHGGESAARMLMGDVAGKQEAMRKVRAIAENQRFKLSVIADSTSATDFLKTYSTLRTEAMREITHVQAGGVEDLSKLTKGTRFNPDESAFTTAMTKGVDVVQTGALVKAQDVLTKGIEFPTQLDRALRLDPNINMGLVDFMKHPNRNKMMATEQYRTAEVKAIFETQKATFSQTYKGNTMIGEVASVIEDARQIPGIGLLVPFGRFFNNTVAFVADGSGVSFLAKVGHVVDSPRSKPELFMRAAVTWGAVLSMVDKERENRKEGLGIFDNPLDDGSVTDERWNFPFSAFKSAAHILSYHIEGKEAPQEVLDAAAGVLKDIDGIRLNKELPEGVTDQTLEAVFGQLTRQLGASGDSLYDFLKSAIAKEVTFEDTLGILQKPGSQVISGWTRFLEPVDVAVGIFTGSKFETMDRKQGNVFLNDSFRYMENMLDFVRTGEEQKFNAATGAQRGVSVGKFMGNRESAATTDTARVMNVLGLPHWQLNEFSMNPEADNRANQLISSLLEREASKLWNNKTFRSQTQDYRKQMWDTAVAKVRNTAMDYMKTGISRTNDRSLALSLEMYESHGRKAIEKALEDYDNADLSELSYGDLQMLDTRLKSQEMFLKMER